MGKYIVETRYEYRTNSGKDFTSWFPYDVNEVTEEDGKQKIKEIQKEYGKNDKITKCSHEYRLTSVEEYKKRINEQEEAVKLAQKRDEEYYKSEEWKKLKKKKREAAKERKKKIAEYEKMRAELKQ